MAMPTWKKDFLDAATEAGALTFGSYTLKSGRQSPYYFNAGIFHSAKNLRALSMAFAHTLAESPIEFDILFGPAYKGIPLATATVDKLPLLDEKRFGNVSYCFDRKVKKSHGIGGNVVGAPLKGKRVMVIDDVITAGTAAREAVEIIQNEGGILVGFVVSMDRLEKRPSETDDDGLPGPSAIGQIRKELGVPVLSIFTLNDVIEDFKLTGSKEQIQQLEDYRSRYAASD